MDVLTDEEVEVDVRGAVSRWPLYAAAASYTLVVSAAILHHEAWADEAQSWLLARDATLVDLWTRLLHYEGTTGLWHTLLHGFVLAGIPYWGMNAFSGLLGLLAAGVVFRYSPFPTLLRLALPFTFFLCYQYPVVARSYSLLPLLLFCCAATYARASERPGLFSTLLCLMAAVSVHGMVLASAVGLSALSRAEHKKRFAVHLVGFAVVVALLAAAARPAPDVTFIAGLNFSFPHFVEVSMRAFANAFTGEWMSSILLVTLSAPLLWRGGGWWFFAFSASMLCGIASVVYSQVWHHGVLFLAWVFAVWISWPNTRRTSKSALAALAIIVAVQGYWTICSVGYDWKQPYSGSLSAARGLRELNPAEKKVYAIGFACTSIQPHFPHNIFANVNDGRPEAYWDWSSRNHVNLDSTKLAESRPDYVMVGYKNEFERGVWTDLVRKSGYVVRRHFEGNTFWQTRILEPESYDLYERDLYKRGRTP